MKKYNEFAIIIVITMVDLLQKLKKEEKNMVERIIGNFFVESGKITKEQLERVLRRQDTERVRLGVIAVAEGMMTAEQAEAVNRMQAVMDKRFGDIAVERSYLTDEQMDKLLRMQGSAYLMFVQKILDENLMDINAINQTIDHFQMAHGFSSMDMEDLKSNDVDRIVPLFIPEEAEECTDIMTIAIRAIIRFVDRNVYLKKAKLVDVDEVLEKKFVKQSLVGKNGVVDGFYESTGALLELASKFGHEEFEELDEDALDSAGEMLNCINGLFASAESRAGNFMELMPPEYCVMEDEIADESVWAIPVYIGGKEMYFMAGKIV